jgi:hypothetical protein
MAQDAMRKTIAKSLRANDVSVDRMATNPTHTLTQRSKHITVADNGVKRISMIASRANCDKKRCPFRFSSMTTPSENEKAEDTAPGQFIPMREPPGRLGAIVRRMKRMAPPPQSLSRPDAQPEKQETE